MITPTGSAATALVLWTSEDFAPTSETEGGLRLLEQLQEFQRLRGVSVEVILKKRTGPGGLLDFLTTASRAAPSVLPDLITLSDADLYRAARAGLVQPLDGLISTELLDDQFDFARALTRPSEALVLGGILGQVNVIAVIVERLYVNSHLEDPPWFPVYGYCWEGIIRSVPFAVDDPNGELGRGFSLYPIRKRFSQNGMLHPYRRIDGTVKAEYRIHFIYLLPTGLMSDSRC